MKKILIAALGVLALTTGVFAGEERNLSLLTKAGTAEIDYSMGSSSYEMKLVINFNKQITALKGKESITFTGIGTVSTSGIMSPTSFTEKAVADFGSAEIEYKFDKKTNKIVRQTRIDTMEKDAEKNKASLGLVTEEIAEISYRENDFFTAIFGDPSAEISQRYIGDYKLIDIYMARGGGGIQFYLSDNDQVFIVRLKKTEGGYKGRLWLAKGSLL